eukprot:461434-Pelagomonas_calceolata.AAC.21
MPALHNCQERDFIREYKIFEMWPRKGTLSVGEQTIITFKYNPTHEGMSDEEFMQEPKGTRA